MKTQALAQIPETKRADGPVVRLSNVVKTYKEGDVEVSAIKGITFKIPRQRFSMIVGPSGSGKTTLLNLIGCIDKPTQGTIFVGGQVRRYFVLGRFGLYFHDGPIHDTLLNRTALTRLLPSRR